MQERNPYKKEVDWSLLHSGLTFATQSLFYQLNRDLLPKGYNKKVSVVIGTEQFDATLGNINFNKEKYPNHQDLIQLRYTENSPLAKRLRTLFFVSYTFLCAAKQIDGSKRLQIKLPNDKKEYLILYSTDKEDVFIADFILANELTMAHNVLLEVNEEAFELDQFDTTAKVIEKEGLIKIRKLNTAIGDSLKQLYNFKCQITGLHPSERYGCNVVEAHHIEYFTKSLNNDSSNIIIIRPDFHRIIHTANPIFDRKKLAFIFANGIEEKVRLNFHL